MQESIPGTEGLDDLLKTCEQKIESKPKVGKDETKGVLVSKIKNEDERSNALEHKKSDNIKNVTIEKLKINTSESFSENNKECEQSSSSFVTSTIG